MSESEKADKEIWQQINDMRKQYNMSEYSFHKDVKQMQRHFKDNIDSFTSQKIATALWKSYDRLFHGNGRKVYYKKYGELCVNELNERGLIVEGYESNEAFFNDLKNKCYIPFGASYVLAKGMNTLYANDLGE